MDEKNKVLTRLNEALEVLVYSNVEEALESAGLAALLDKPIPEDVLRVYANSKYIQQNLVHELLGLDPIDFQDIREGLYPNQSLEKYAGELITGHYVPTYPFILIEGLDGDLIPEQELSDYETFFPLLYYSASHMFFLQSDDPQTHGLFGELFGHARLFAPSLEAHYLDLISGVESGRYTLEDDRAYFPGAWHYRKKLEQGLVKMSKYGDVLDLNGEQI